MRPLFIATLLLLAANAAPAAVTGAKPNLILILTDDHGYGDVSTPHFPIEPPAEWAQRVKLRDPGMDDKRATNVAFVEHLDDGIGRVLAVLESTGLDRNTLVVFTADNGGSLPHAQGNHLWRDGKQSHYDDGLRVPFAARWPGTVATRSRSDYAGLTFDVAATFVEIAEVARPSDFDAVSLLPFLRGEAPPSAARDLFFVRWEGGPHGGKSYEALIRRDWMLLQNNPYSALELYDLKDDPREERNMIKEQPRLARELELALRAHIQRGGATPWRKLTS